MGSPSHSPFSPFRNREFLALWTAWLVANVCMWMNDVAAAWLMTSLSDKPLMVALVQSASTLPVFMFAIPSGALADIVDRRRFLIFTQIWVACIALLLCSITATDNLTAYLLLLLTLLNGLGLAMRWPTHSALIAECVPRDQLPVATALSGMAMNASRILGPLFAGFIIAAWGGVYVFMLNAILSVISALVIIRLRRESTIQVLPRERFWRALRVGFQHVRESPRMQAVLRRVFAFSISSIALIALLPLVARNQFNGGAETFAMLMAAIGTGAIAGGTLLPLLRRRFSREDIIDIGSVLYAGAMLCVAYAPAPYIALPALFAAGMAWISIANSLNVSAHFALPDWVRARGVAFYQTAMMGGSALGAACWGLVVEQFSLATSLTAAASVAIIGWLLTRRQRIVGEPEQGPLRPAVWAPPELAVPIELGRGPVQITVEYRIDPKRADEFLTVMRESRRVWLQNGVQSWSLFRDVSEQGRYFEQFQDASWGDYLRRNNRITATHVALKQQKWAFHIAGTPPVITRSIAELPEK